MFSWLKKHFIPHIGNDHRPHILRGNNVRNIAVALILLEILVFVMPIITRINIKGGMAAVLPAILANLTNEERQSQNLQILAVSPILNKAAEMKAEDMATKGYFAHTSPEGKTPWYWLEKVGYKYQYAGENLAVNFSDSIDVTNAWMASPTHKANIVKGNYTEIGTGIATGLYEGKETIFVAQVYANPLPEIFKQTVQNKPAVTKKPISVVKEEPTNVLGAEAVANTGNTDVSNPIKSVQQPTFWQKLLASPRNTTNIILYIIFGIIVLALLLYIFIKMRNHHKDLITNGLILLAIVGAIFVANYYFSHNNMIVTQS
ncbi:MAG: CAP domain-containing protein, partial [Candidatus Woesebacteria bacterium]|nr:CAP domain-containing protein [Candidatus Woesebacteria bacterium]